MGWLHYVVALDLELMLVGVVEEVFLSRLRTSLVMEKLMLLEEKVLV